MQQNISQIETMISNAKEVIAATQNFHSFRCCDLTSSSRTHAHPNTSVAHAHNHSAPITICIHLDLSCECESELEKPLCAVCVVLCRVTAPKDL